MRSNNPALRPQRIVIALLLLAALAACGQKGPLRRPDAPTTATAATVSPGERLDPSTLASRRQNPHE